MTAPQVVEFQIAYSTAGEVRLIYDDGSPVQPSVALADEFPGGLYRVVDGQLVRLLPGVPPSE